MEEMQSVLKSDLFENSIYQKKYPKDFFTSELIENRIEINSKGVSGTIHETQLDGIFMVHKNIIAPNGYHIEVSNDFSMFALHFEITGSYAYTPFERQTPLLKVKDFQYNMFYLPSTNGLLQYTGTPRRTLEIFFTSGLIEKLVGKKYGQILGRIDSAIEQGKPFVFWKQPRPITPELGRAIEQIIACPFSGQLKKTYLQSKITTNLLDLLLDANGKNNTDSTIDLPQSDLDSLHIVERYIETNLNKTLSIPELTAVAGFNSSKLKRDFKRVYGTTIFKYITKLRMETASDLIVNKYLTIAQAAHEVGYSNPQHFTKAFKRTLGYLPSELKK